MALAENARIGHARRKWCTQGSWWATGCYGYEGTKKNTLARFTAWRRVYRSASRHRRPTEYLSANCSGRLNKVSNDPFRSREFTAMGWRWVFLVALHARLNTLGLNSTFNPRRTEGRFDQRWRQRDRQTWCSRVDFYGPGVPDPKLPESIEKSYQAGWGRLGTFRTKLVVRAIRSVKSVPEGPAGPEGPTLVKLTVKRDGREKPAPNQITLSFNNHAVQMPVRDGKFEVPPEITGALRVTFAADVDGDQIRISELPAKLFSLESWTLLLAERNYPDDYRWAVPKGTDIPASCILVVDSVHADPGTVVLDPHCRTKRE